MPFPFLGTLAAAGGMGILSGLLGNRRSKAETNLIQSQRKQIDYQLGRQQNVIDPYVDKMRGELTDFYKALATGDSKALAQYYKAPLNQLTKGLNQASDMIKSRYSRGGVQDLLLGQNELGAYGQMSAILSGAPQEGYGMLANIMQGLQGLGPQYAQMGMQGIQQLLSNEQTRSQNFSQLMQGTGSVIGKLLNTYLESQL